MFRGPLACLNIHPKFCESLKAEEKVGLTNVRDEKANDCGEEGRHDGANDCEICGHRRHGVCRLLAK